VSARYKIVGLIRLDADSGSACTAPTCGSTIEQVLLTLAVSDAMAGAPAWPALRRRIAAHGAPPAIVHADLNALLAELQSHSDELERCVR
jgi:hypothetical protein